MRPPRRYAPDGRFAASATWDTRHSEGRHSESRRTEAYRQPLAVTAAPRDYESISLGPIAAALGVAKGHAWAGRRSPVVLAA